jgi:hypothetical protein
MSFELTPDQQIFLNLYSSQYNNVVQLHTSLIDQTNRLIPIMNELRHNIQAIYADARAEANRRGSSSSTGIREGFTTPVTTNRIFSDIATPIRGSSYSGITYSNVSSYGLFPHVPVSDDVPGTTNRIFSEIAVPLNTECPITLVPFEPTSEVAQINVCGHIFVRSELAQWFQDNTNCPTCRAYVRQRFVVDGSNNIIN